MTKAFRLHVEEDGIAGGYDVVTASDLRRMGKPAARSLNFVCAHEGCHIKVRPVFPEAPRKDGTIPDCHFRALRDVLHIGHGATTTTTQAEPVESADIGSTSDTHPSGWRDPTLPKQSATSATKGSAGVATDPDLLEGKVPSRGAKSGTNAGPSATSKLQKLVDRWESEQPQILDEEFTFPGRKNVRWRDMFIRIESDQFDQELGTSKRSFFYGNIVKINRWGSAAFELEFLGGAIQQKVTCYAEISSDEQAKHPTLAYRLKKVAGTTKGRAYILGRPAVRNGMPKIYIDSFKNVWIVI